MPEPAPSGTARDLLIDRLVLLGDLRGELQLLDLQGIAAEWEVVLGDQGVREILRDDPRLDLLVGVELIDRRLEPLAIKNEPLTTNH